MSQLARRRFTFLEYVRLEEYSNVRHEFFDGAIYAMAGGSPSHAALAARVIRSLSAQLSSKGCEVFTSDLRVRVAATGLTTYPDVTVVCGKLETDPQDASTVLNPRVVVEVLSDSTEEYERGEKCEHYRLIPSLRAIVLVSQRTTSLEIWQHDDDGTWSSRVAGGGESAVLAEIGCALEVTELFRNLPEAG
ncbi:MAG TPA: Uma2 family endonuclease [Terriglobales bacterium]|nr:Uma2 family endonuclease [Terriglobales bacterium]